jgi:hypothetical protein
MDGRDVCRLLECSPMQLSEWVEKGLPVHRYDGYDYYVEFWVEEVKAWLKEQGIADWPKEKAYDLDVPIRSVFHALARKEITPFQAERVLVNIEGVV